MEQFYELLVKLGPGWMVIIVIGIIAGNVVYIVAYKQNQKLIREGHAEQLALKDETIKILKETKESAVLVMSQDKSRLQAERDSYKTQLHDEKNSHQATQLKLVEFESRPDLSQILQTEQTFHSQKMAVNNKMLETLDKLDSKLDKELKEHAAICIEATHLMHSVIMVLEKKGLLDEPSEKLEDNARRIAHGNRTDSGDVRGR